MFLVRKRGHHGSTEGHARRPEQSEQQESGDDRGATHHFPIPERPLYTDSRKTWTGSMPKTTYLVSCGAPLSVRIFTVNTRPGARASARYPTVSG